MIESIENIKIIYDYALKRYQFVKNQEKYYIKSEELANKNDQLKLSDRDSRELWILRGQLDVLQSIIDLVDKMKIIDKNRRKFFDGQDQSHP